MPDCTIWEENVRTGRWYVMKMLTREKVEHGDHGLGVQGGSLPLACSREFEVVGNTYNLHMLLTKLVPCGPWVLVCCDGCSQVEGGDPHDPIHHDSANSGIICRFFALSLIRILLTNAKLLTFKCSLK
jgi:hypothetical protein